MDQCVLDFFHGELECSLSALGRLMNVMIRYRGMARAKKLKKDPKVKPVFRSRLA